MKRTTLLLSFFLLMSITMFTQDIVSVHMKVPVESTVTIIWDWTNNSSINSDEWLDKPLHPNSSGDLYLCFIKENIQSYIFKVEQSGYRTVIGRFNIARNSYFQVSLPPAKKDKSALDGVKLYDEAIKQQLNWNYKKANKLYLKSAKIGDVRAMNSLADNYHNGNGCAKNDSKAMYWYGVAKQFGSYVAELCMQHIKRQNGR